MFYLIETLFAFYLVARFDPEEILSIVMMAGVSVSVLSLIMVFLFPQFGVTESARDGLAWCGLFTDRTSAGKCMVFLLSPALIFRRRSRNYQLVIYILLLSVMTFMAHAATARIITVLYIAFMASISFPRKFGRRSSLLIVGTLLVAGASTVCVGLQFLPRILGAVGRNATLSGRTGIWSLLLGSIAKRPLLRIRILFVLAGPKGKSANVIVGAHWAFGYAHNGVLEIWLQLGLVGTVLFFVTLFSGDGKRMVLPS